MLGLLDPVISRFTDTRFVVMASHPRQELLLEAMQIGARHFIARESLVADPQQLGAVLHKIIPNGTSRRAGHGLVCTILSASGGVGATLLAVNLANELRLASMCPTLLVDMDPWCGAAAAYLGLHPSYGLDAVLADADRIDGDLIKSSAAIHDESLYVLESPRSATTPPPQADPRRGGAPGGGGISYENLPRFLAACKESFPCTVVDAPRLPLAVTSELAAASNMTLIPFQATVVGIRAVRDLMSALVGQGCSGELLTPVMMRYRKRGAMISYEEACKALSRPSLGRIENDFETAVESINFGKPLSQTAPRSGLRKAIASCATQVHQAHATGQVPAPTW
jgi:pilus assembly protein CpaE